MSNQQKWIELMDIFNNINNLGFNIIYSENYLMDIKIDIEQSINYFYYIKFILILKDIIY